jgi:hypothetical protein
VVESDERGAEVVRGLISRSRIERHLHSEQFPPPIAGDAVHRTNHRATSAAPAAPVNPTQ